MNVSSVREGLTERTTSTLHSELLQPFLWSSSRIFNEELLTALAIITLWLIYRVITEELFPIDITFQVAHHLTYPLNELILTKAKQPWFKQSTLKSYLNITERDPSTRNGCGAQLVPAVHGRAQAEFPFSSQGVSASETAGWRRPYATQFPSLTISLQGSSLVDHTVMA